MGQLRKPTGEISELSVLSIELFDRMQVKLGVFLVHEGLGLFVSSFLHSPDDLPEFFHLMSLAADVDHF